MPFSNRDRVSLDEKRSNSVGSRRNCGRNVDDTPKRAGDCLTRTNREVCKARFYGRVCGKVTPARLSHFSCKCIHDFTKAESRYLFIGEPAPLLNAGTKVEFGRALPIYDTRGHCESSLNTVCYRLTASGIPGPNSSECRPGEERTPTWLARGNPSGCAGENPNNKNLHVVLQIAAHDLGGGFLLGRVPDGNF